MPRKFEPLKTLPRRLRSAMALRKMSGADLMRATNLGTGQISNYLNGYQEAGATRIRQMAIALNVSADYLLGLTDDWRPFKRRTNLEEDD